MTYEVKFIPNSPFVFSYGGFEIQTKLILKAVQNIGVNANFIDYYDTKSSFDIVHIWGATQGSAKIAELATKAGKKVIVTALLSYIETPQEKLRFYISDFIKKYEYLKSFNKNCSKFVVVNEKQKALASKYFNINPSKIEVIPHVVDDSFYSQLYQKGEGYVLCSGNICRRKNQLNLVKACIEIKQPLILLGPVLDGEDSYANEIIDIILHHPYIKWVKGLKHASEEMLTLYNKASIIALPSFIEQQPICLLEGAVLGKPLLTSNKPYGKQKIFENAKLVDPNSVHSISEGILSILKNPNSYITPPKLLEQCTMINVGLAYEKVYKSLI